MYTENPRYGARDKVELKPRPRPGQQVRVTPKPKPAQDKRRGTLPWPAQGQVVTQFGIQVDPKYKTVTRSSGIDIATTKGGNVLAVDAGKVSFADNFMGYGRMIILDHGNRCHSIYSKLDDMKVRVGEAVAKGAPVGVSGDTLHFEFRVGGKSVDPLEWLVPR
jgi:septal ring factor EnvC (AmiA/AmiB activator)